MCVMCMRVCVCVSDLACFRLIDSVVYVRHFGALFVHISVEWDP